MDNASTNRKWHRYLYVAVLFLSSHLCILGTANILLKDILAYFDNDVATGMYLIIIVTSILLWYYSLRTDSNIYKFTDNKLSYEKIREYREFLWFCAGGTISCFAYILYSICYSTIDEPILNTPHIAFKLLLMPFLFVTNSFICSFSSKLIFREN